MDIALIESGSNKGFNLYVLVLDERCQVIEYFNSLDRKIKGKIISLFKLIAENGIPHNKEKYRNLGDKINELKTGGVRILCFTGGPELPRSLILTHGFFKPHQKVLRREKQKALKWREQFFQEDFNIVELNMER